MAIARRMGAFVMACLVGLSFGGDVEAKGKKLQARTKRRAPEVPPIAFYLADYASVKGDSPSDVVKKCEARRAKTRRETSDTYKDRPCAETVVVVRGPYKHLPADVFKNYGRDYVYHGSDGTWVDATGESPCFPGGTLVTTPRGARPIEALEVGDLVSSWDLAKDHLAVGRVERVKKRTTTTIQTITLGHGEIIRATPNHPFFVADARAWTAIGEIESGTSLLRLDGEHVAPDPIVMKTTRDDEPIDVYDVTISPHRNLFANGVLVHNY